MPGDSKSSASRAGLFPALKLERGTVPSWREFGDAVASSKIWGASVRSQICTRFWDRYEQPQNPHSFTHCRLASQESGSSTIFSTEVAVPKQLMVNLETELADHSDWV